MRLALSPGFIAFRKGCNDWRGRGISYPNLLFADTFLSLPPDSNSRIQANGILANICFTTSFERHKLNRRKFEVELYSYGEYSRWEKDSKALPRILNIDTRVEAEIGTEFGYVLRIKKAKGAKINFRVIHPPFNDEFGKPADDFTGEVYINSNDYEFFLGDCIWEPLEDKLGPWRLITELEGKVVADKTLQLVRKL